MLLYILSCVCLGSLIRVCLAHVLLELHYYPYGLPLPCAAQLSLKSILCLPVARQCYTLLAGVCVWQLPVVFYWPLPGSATHDATLQAVCSAEVVRLRRQAMATCPRGAILAARRPLFSARPLCSPAHAVLRSLGRPPPPVQRTRPPALGSGAPRAGGVCGATAARHRSQQPHRLQVLVM